MKIFIVILSGLFILQMGLFSSASAQVKQVRIKVNGLACPFCAYGLEKKLKKLDGVGKVEISLNKGLATLNSKAEQSVEFKNLKTIVKAAGFSTSEIIVTVNGVINKSGDSYILAVANSPEKFILKNNEKLQSLISSLSGTGKVFSVKGILSQEQISGLNSHSFALSIQEFEMK